MSLEMENLMAEFSRKGVGWSRRPARATQNQGRSPEEGPRVVFASGFHPSSCPVTCSRPKTGSLLSDGKLHFSSFKINSPFLCFLFLFSAADLSLRSVCWGVGGALAKGWAYGEARAVFRGGFAQQRILDQNL